MLRTTFLLSALLGAVFANGQSPQDCVGAVQICRSVINSDHMLGEGPVDDMFFNTSCLQYGENNSVWLKVTIIAQGQLEFTITPVAATDDYDFVVYDLTNDSCQSIVNGNLNPIRCNFKANVGGESGLASGYSDMFSGVTGPPFCAPVTVDSGDVYYIMIDNFTNGGSGYTLDLKNSPIQTTGNCQDSIIFSRIVQADIPKFNFHPNPAQTEIVLFWPQHDQTRTICLIGLDGRTLISEVSYPGADSHALHVEELPVGLYLLEVSDGYTSHREKVLISR